MHDRVVSIELEAKKTRQLLAHIAYVKSHGRSDSLSTTPGQSNTGGRSEGHTRYVDYGELELSPYLKQVLDLPPAVITTDVFEPPAPQDNNATSSLGVFRSRSSSPKSNHISPKAVGFNVNNRDRSQGAGSAQRPTERPRSPQPSPKYQRNPSPSSQVMHRELSEHDQRHASSEENWKVQLSPEAHYKSYANSLRNSPAMQKYAAYSSVPYGYRASPAQQPMQRGSAEHEAYLNSLANRSPRSPRSPHNISTSEADRLAAAQLSPVGASAGNAAHSPRHGLVVNTTAPTRFATALDSSGAYSADYGAPGAYTIPTSSAPSTPHTGNGAALAPSPSHRYRNSCQTQRTEQAGVTVIDSKIDDLLGDSLNIEEKDGRVYVHFQSKFMLPGL